MDENTNNRTHMCSRYSSNTYSMELYVGINLVIDMKGIKEFVYAQASRRSVIDLEKDAGELDAIIRFTEEIVDNAVVGMVEMLADGKMIGMKSD